MPSPSVNRLHRTEGPGYSTQTTGISLRIAVAFLVLFAAAGAVVTAALPGDECLKCHGKAGLSVQRHGETVSLSVTPTAFRVSAHGRLGCAGCHEGYDSVPHAGDAATRACPECHDEARRALEASVHASTPGAEGISCTDCHPAHEVRPVGAADGPASALHQEKTCGRCHPVASGHPDEGPVVTPSCITCHGAHAVRGPLDPDSPVSHGAVAATCGACHEREAYQFGRSIHGTALREGHEEAPTCISCHGEHPLRVVGDPQSPVSAGNLPNTCAACHDAEEIVSRYSLPGNRLETYEDSYHGLGNRYGQAVTAHCASCHGAHEILPAADPDSSIHPARLPQTCGQCHPGAGTTFARGKVHLTATREDAPGVWLVRSFYTWFIGILVSLFLIYIALDVYRHLRSRHDPSRS